MNLARLVNLEWLIQVEEGFDAAEATRARDRAIGEGLLNEWKVTVEEAHRRVADDRSFRERLCNGWLERVEPGRAPLPGRRVQQGLSLTGWFLVIAGLAMGTAAARVFLAYDGTSPVNVLEFGGFFFGLQILLLLLLAGFLLRAGRGRSAAAPSHRLVGAMARSRLIARLLGDEAGDTARVLAELRARSVLYADLERWSLFALAQRFGVAFNLGALLTCLYLVVFSDLVFAWSTTLDVSPAAVHALVSALALPWSFVPDAVPTLQVVSVSEWSRLDRAFTGEAGAAGKLAARWWSFLVAGLVTYGLLPRLAAAALGAVCVRGALRAAALDHAGYQRLYDRLLPPAIDRAGPPPESVAGEGPAAGGDAGPVSAPGPAGAPLSLVVWGRLGERTDVLAGLAARRLSGPVAAVNVAGGAEMEQDMRTLDALGTADVPRVVVLFEGGQQPTREVHRFLDGLRTVTGAGRAILVGVVVEGEDGSFGDAEADELEGWRRALATRGDPHLWVERMELPG